MCLLAGGEGRAVLIVGSGRTGSMEVFGGREVEPRCRG